MSGIIAFEWIILKNFVVEELFFSFLFFGQKCKSLLEAFLYSSTTDEQSVSG